MRRAWLFSVITMSVGCGQKIVVVECDGHVASDRDGGAIIVTRDGGDFANDGGEADGGQADAGARDGGPVSGCTGSPYCITSVVPSATRAAARTPVTFTASVDNAAGAALTYTVDVAELVAVRRTGLPAFDPTDVTMTLSVDPQGVATFVMSDVPTWFATTTFTIRIHAMAPGGPDVWADADVTIDGNVVFADGAAIYAVASDGAPATSVNFTYGQFLTGQSFIRNASDLLVARNGELLVLDRGTTPQRIKRFELSGENVLLGEFETDEAGTPFLEMSAGYGMAQLDDGRVVVIDTQVGRTPPVRFVVFGENGIYQRSLVPPNGSSRFDGIAPAEGNTFVVGEYTPGRQILRFDPDSGVMLGVFASEVSSISGMTRALDGTYYVGTGGTIARLSATGARMMVNGLPGSEFDDWEYLAPFGPGRVIATTPVSSSTLNIAVIEGTTSLGWFRLSGANNPVRIPQGIATLE